MSDIALWAISTEQDRSEGCLDSRCVGDEIIIVLLTLDVYTAFDCVKYHSLQSFDSSAFYSLPLPFAPPPYFQSGLGIGDCDQCWGSSVGRFDLMFSKFQCLFGLQDEGVRGTSSGTHAEFDRRSLDVAEIVLQARLLPVQFIVRRFMIGAENPQHALNFESLGCAQL
jgi:hypothetical protein